MKKHILLYIIVLVISGCSTKTVKYYSIGAIQYPEWIVFTGYINEARFNEHEHNKNNIFIWSSYVGGTNYESLRIIVNPQIAFKDKNIRKINIKEITIIRDNEEIILLKNKIIRYTIPVFTDLVKIKFTDFEKYYGEMNNNTQKKIRIRQEYRFDDGPLIIEESDYDLSCFEIKYNPIEKYAFWY